MLKRDVLSNVLCYRVRTLDVTLNRVAALLSRRENREKRPHIFSGIGAIISPRAGSIGPLSHRTSTWEGAVWTDNITPHGSDMMLFCVVAELRSMTGAAKRLGVSRTLISRRVARLEERLGTVLLHRSRKSIVPTEAGKLMLARGRELMRQVKAIEDEVRELSDRPGGYVRCTAATTLGAVIGQVIATDFLAQFPEIVVQWDFAEQMVDIIREGYDVAVRIAPAIDDDELIARPVAKCPIVICGTKSYLQKFGTPKKVADLAEHNCIRLKGSNEWLVHHNGEEIRFPVSGNFVSRSDPALIEACCRDLGLLNVPEFFVRELLDEGKLVEVLPGAAVGRTIYVVYANREIPRKVRLLVDFLVENIKVVISERRDSATG